MKYVRGAAVISLMFWASAAYAQQAGEAITITRGEQIEVSLQQGGVVTSRDAAPEMPVGAQAGAALMASQPIEEPTQEIVSLPGGLEGAPPLPTEALRFTFAQVPGSSDTLLTVENGYDRALTYRAIITVDGQRHRTDVCLVPPGRLLYEHWPYAIESIEVFELQLRVWSPGDPRPCR